MRSHYPVAIHASQYPEQVADCLRESLRHRRIDPKFHYESRKQARQWSKLHEAYSPARRDMEVERMYAAAFDSVTASLEQTGESVRVVGLGCGGGQKESLLLKRLSTADGSQLSFTAVDVSPSLVLASLLLIENQNSDVALDSGECRTAGLVCDFGHASNPFPIIDVLAGRDSRRVITFFGMLPNIESGSILDRLRELLGPKDVLLISANLAPGANYRSGVNRVLPQYDNSLTRDWLMSFLMDLGICAEDGEIQWGIESCPHHPDLLRLVAWYRFARAAEIQTESETFAYEAGDELRLFYSYRHTPGLLDELLGGHGLKIQAQWISPSEEEGVFKIGRSERFQ